MKHKYRIPLFTFLAGIITGIAGVFVWQVWGKPTKPAYDGWADEFIEPDYYEGLGLEAVTRAVYSVGKTQPVKVVE